MMYKIIHGLIDVAFDDLFSPNRSTRGHVYKLYCFKSNLNVRSHFFSQRCITAWNALSHDVVTSPSLNIFNSRLYNVSFEWFVIIMVFTFYRCIITRHSITLLLFYIVIHILTVMFHYFRHTFSAILKVVMHHLAILIISFLTVRSAYNNECAE